MLKFLPNFVYRVPRLPLSAFEAGEYGYDINAFLRERLSDPAVAEAIYLSSPVFYGEVEQFLTNAEYVDRDPRKVKRFQITALKYLNRLCYRPTPFGTFAGCASASIASSHETLAPASSPKFIRNLRLDTAYLVYLARELRKVKGLSTYLRYFPNNTIQAGNRRARYIEMIDSARGRAYNLSTFGQNDYTKAVLARAQGGATGRQLAAELTDDEITENEALSFVEELVNAGILISELEPKVVGAPYHDALFITLTTLVKSIPATDEAAGEANLFLTFFTRLRRLLSVASANGSIAAYRAVTDAVTEFHGEAYPDVLRMDAAVAPTVPPRIDFKQARQVQKGLKAFLRLSAKNLNGTMEKFRVDFSKRYEERFIPLLTVLDPELGIGFGTTGGEHHTFTPLVDNLPVSARASARITKQVRWDYHRHNFLLQRITAALATGEGVVRLTHADIEQFTYDLEHVPPTSAALLRVVPRGEGKEDLICFQELGKDSGTALLGRFAHTEKGIHDIVSSLCDYEDESIKGCEVAEINHLANIRIGNITERPRTRRHEIAFVTKSNAEADERKGLIGVDKIYVGVRKGRILLLNSDTGREIIPRLSTAHNYAYNCLPLYKFLSCLQEEHHGGYHEYLVDLGPIAGMLEHIPRIQVDNFVLRPASWMVNTTDIRKLKEASLEDFGDNVRSLFTERGWPLCSFVFEPGKTPVYLDLNNPAAVFLLTQLVTEQKLKLTEAIGMDPQRQWYATTEGTAYNHEILLPFRNEVFAKRPAARRWNILPETKRPERTFVPGDAWCYFKFYLGAHACEKVVAERLGPLMHQLRDEGLVEELFFLRLTDPDYHLRLRVRPREASCLGEIITRINVFFQPEVKSGVIWKVQLDTYQRELERYGNWLAVPSEALFDIDSRAVLDIKGLVVADSANDRAWLLSLRMCADYIRKFCHDKEEMRAFLIERRSAYGSVFNTNKLQKRDMTQRYLNYRADVEAALIKDRYPFEQEDALRARLAAFRAELDSWYASTLNEAGFERRSDLLASYIHMSVLRFVSSKNKLHEHVIYFMLERFFMRHVLRPQLPLNDKLITAEVSQL